MTETLDRSGMPEGQSKAVVRSMALAMETFLVTPEILDTKLSLLKREVLDEVRSNKREVARLDVKVDKLDDKVSRLDDKVDGLSTKIDGLQQAMLDQQRSLTRHLMSFSVALFAGLLAILGVSVGLG